MKNIIRRIYHGIRRASWSDFIWQVDQAARVARLKMTSEKSRQALVDKLTKNAKGSTPPPLITLVLPSRHLGHRYSRLENYLKSFLEMTEDPQRVEILVKVDNDDDHSFFCRIKQKFQGQVRMRFLVSERGDGYGDMYKYNAALLAVRAPSCRILIHQSDDAIFVQPKWDTEVISRLSDYPHDYFICTDCPFEEAISIIGPNPETPVPVYWVRGDLFPIMGSGILRCTEKIAREHPDWTSLGNGFNIDGFVGDLLRRLWQRHQLKLHVEVPTITREFAARGWLGIKGREELRTRTLLKFFSREDQMVRDEMVDEIASCVKAGGL